MAKSETIYQLVKSLNKNEKRFFTLQSSLGGEGQNYLKIFNLLDKSKNYDAETFRKKIGKANINISHEQNYLQKMILRSLRYYYSEQGIFTQLTESLRNAELLHKKRLNDLNLEQLQKSKELAEKYEYYLLHIELLDWENRVNARLGNTKLLEDIPVEKKLNERSKLMMDYFDWQHVYLIAQKEALIILTKGSSVSVENKHTLKEIINVSEKYLEKCKHSFRITEICLSTLYGAYSYLGDFKKAFIYCKKVVALFHEHPHFKDDLGYKYYAHSSNLVSRLINLKQFTPALEQVDLLRHFLNDKKTISANEISFEARYTISAHTMRICALTGNFDKGMDAVKEYERMAKNNTSFLRPGMRVTFNMFPARIYFGNNNFQKTLKYLNEIINYNQSELPQDFVQYAYLFRLITHYEMGNTDLLDSLVQSAKRLFKEKWKNNDSGKIICEHMRQLLNAKSQLQKKNIFNSLAKELKEEEKNNNERLDYIDFVRWAESK